MDVARQVVKPALSCFPSHRVLCPEFADHGVAVEMLLRKSKLQTPAAEAFVDMVIGLEKP